MIATQMMYSTVMAGPRVALLCYFVETENTNNTHEPKAEHADYSCIHNSEAAFIVSPIVIQDIEFERRALRRSLPLTLQPILSESDEFYKVEIEEYGMSVLAYTRPELFDAVEDMIAVLWREYALEEDNNLTISGRELKERLLKDFRII